jgi:hypothetical protein
MIKCSECGYENMDGLDYCDGCGAKLEPASAPAPSSGSSPEASATHPAGAEAGGATAAPEPAAIEEMAAAGAPAETGSGGASAAASGTEQAADEHAPAKAPTGEMNAGAGAGAVQQTSAGGLMMKAKLAIIRGGRRGQEFELEPGNNLVGRWDPETGSFPEVDLDADDPEAKISRKHALIRLDGSKITIEDIGSLNGTYVNRQPRLQPGNPVDLKDGDEIIIGKTFLKLSINPIS